MNNNNNNSEEISALESTIEFSLEPYCEMIHIFFVFGPKRNEYEIEVPIDALNNEIYHSGFKIIPYLSSDKNDPDLEIRVELPPAQIPWSEAIRQFEKYLKPPHKNNKRITNSPILPVNLAPSFWFPLYYLTKRFDMQIFRSKLMKINFTTNYCITILSQIYEMTSLGFQFPEIDSIIFKTLSSNLDSLPPQSFRGIEMASAILKIIETDPSNSNNPPSLIEWLINVFPKFAENPNQQTNRQNILKIINYLKVNDSKIAFIYWCYSLFFDSIDSDSILDEYIEHFELKDYYKLLFNVPYKSIVWLLKHINIGLNRVQITQLIIQWIKTNSSEYFYNSLYQKNRSYESQTLFDFAVENHLLNVRQLDTQALCTLLPFAFKFNPNGELVDQFIYRIKDDYRSAISFKNRNYAMLPWGILTSTFSLIHNPVRKDLRRSNLIEDMRTSYKAIDSIFYHWIYTNRRNPNYVNMSVVSEYLKLPSTDVSIARSPHRRLMVFDILTCFPPSPQTAELKRSLFDRSMRQPFNFVDCLNRLLSKTTLQLTKETLDFIKHQVRRSVNKMAIFCSVLEKFYIPIPDPRLIDPVNEYSVKSCINILSRSVINNPSASRDYVDALVQIVKPMATYAFNLLSVQEISNLARIISFHEFITDNYISRVDEDTVLFYAFSTQNFRATIMNKSGNAPINWKQINSTLFQSELNLINWSHVSARALVKLISPYLDFLQTVNFQFDEEDEIISNLPIINNKKVAQSIFSKWMTMNPFSTANKNLAALPPKTVSLYLIDFDYRPMTEEEDNKLKEQFGFIGYSDIRIIFVNEDTVYSSEDDEAVIVYKNIMRENKEMPSTSIKSFINSLFSSQGVPIVMNSLVLLQILEECPDEWYSYVGENKGENYEFLFPKTDEIEANQEFNSNYGYNYIYSGGFPAEGNGNGSGSIAPSNSGGGFNQGYGGYGPYGGQGGGYDRGYGNYNGNFGGNGGYGSFNGNYGGNGGYGYQNNFNGYNSANYNNGGYYPAQIHTRQNYNNPSEHIQWKEPAPTLLPLKKDLIQFSIFQNSDYYFKSIPFYPKFDSQFLRSKIEWRNKRILACSLIGRPLSIFNFGLSVNLNPISKDENPLSMFYHYVVLKQTSECLLSLLSESVAGINPVFIDNNAPPDEMAAS